MGRWHQTCASITSVVLAFVTGEYAGSAEVDMRPRVVQTQFSTDDTVIASFVGGPCAPDTDVTSMLQMAIDSVAKGGGGTVFLKAGVYRLDGPIVVKETVTLRGDWSRQAPYQGTILAVYSGRGDAEGEPAITIERGAGVREVTVWYPEQDPAAIVPYPWTFRTSTSVAGDNYTVQNATLVNPYQAFKTGPEGNELHTIRNVCGTPLQTGVWIDTTTDIGRLIHVDFSPKWWIESRLPGSPRKPAARKALRQFLEEQATAVDMGRSDWEYLYALRVEGYAIGLRIREGQHGTTNAVLFGSQFLNCGTPLLLEKLNGVGLSATGCVFSSSRDAAVLAPATFDTVTQFNSCSFSCPNGAGVLLEGTGALTFHNCTFTDWRSAALDAASGASVLMNCVFANEGMHVQLGPDVRLARILGNTFAGEPHIQNDSQRGDIMIAHALDRPEPCPAPDTSLAREPRLPRPSSRQMLSVTHFGAAPHLEDNTRAFNEALQAARSGITVYVPPGYYRFAGSLRVPSGAELRGSFDVPHHTVSGGSVLMPLGGKGDPDALPFIELEPGAGLRGLTIWYPEQNLMHVVPYPWAIRALGRKCWLINVTLGNAYQGADFWTCPSGGHVISYLAGATLKRGLFVSKSRGDGWVEDVQLNPHYALRLPKDLPRPAYEHEPFNEIIDQQRGQLEAMVFGNCSREHLTRNFLYAAYDGLAFRDDGGGSNARVIMHGTDTGSRAAVFEAAGPKGIELINTQLVPLGDYEVGGLIVEETFGGRLALYNTQMWAGNKSAIISGRGDVTLQQMNTVSGNIEVRGGEVRAENLYMQRVFDAHMSVSSQESTGSVAGCICPAGPFRVLDETGPARPDSWRLRANSLSIRPAISDGNADLHSGWEPGEPIGLESVIAEMGGGLRAVSGGMCTPTAAQVHSGSAALRIAGHADDPEHSYIYFKLFDGPIGIYPDTTLTYWFLPADGRSRHVTVDMVFSDGSTLRDSGMRTTDGESVHPGGGKGIPGEWRRIEIPVGSRHADKVISAVLVAYDKRGEGGAFEAFMDDLVIESREGPAAYAVTCAPRGGTYAAPVSVRLAAPGNGPVRYSVNGPLRAEDASRFTEAIVLDTPGVCELHYAIERPDGTISSVVFGELYEIK